VGTWKNSQQPQEECPQPSGHYLDFGYSRLPCGCFDLSSWPGFCPGFGELAGR
jgi:hypothetical protein